MEAQQLLKQGVACRVGNGDNVSILNNQWLPNTENPYMVTVNESIKGQMVSALMGTEEKRWDMNLIHDIFEDRDSNLNVATSLSSNDSDSWYWRKEKCGNCSVKSAYVLVQEKKPEINSCGTLIFWKRFWDLKVPTKVKNFMWSAITECLPTKTLLRMKQVNVNVL